MASKRGAKAAAATKSLAEKAKAGDQDALAAVTEIVENFNAWQQAKDSKKRVAKDTKEASDREEAAFKNAVEDSMPTNAGAQTVLGKLQTIEQRWQDWEETKAHGVEERKTAKDILKEAEAKLDRSVSESAQLVLNFKGKAS